MVEPNGGIVIAIKNLTNSYH